MSIRHQPLPEIEGARPPCFDPVQWADWVNAERTDAKDRGYKPDADGYCTHCTLSYQTVMKARSRCLHPTVKFIEVSPGQWEGRRPA